MGCGKKTKKYNNPVRKFVEEAEKTYKEASSQMDAIFAEPIGKDKLASIKEKKPKFE